ncbi:MAG TPA: ABC transporter substrate-binding protein [Nevskiaceae bacterium]
MTFKRLIFPLVLCLLPVLVSAQQANTPEASLKGSVEQLQSLIEQHRAQYKANPQSFYKVVNEVAVPHFDVRYIAQIVMGRYWREATPAQRQAFAENFKDMMIRSYANGLLENASTTKVEWKPSRYQAGDKTATVRTVMARDDGQNIPIDFAMRLVDGHWKVYDIVIDNISLVLNFRTQITTDMQQNGIDAVITKLKRQQLSAPPGVPQAGAKR